MREADPANPHIPAIEQMVADRGWCVNSFASVEYLFGDLIWQLRGVPEYSSILSGEELPLSLGGRIKKLLEILGTGGPISPYEDDIRQTITEMEALSAARQYFAHGHCTFLHTPGGDAAMMFRRFVPPPKGGKVSKEAILVRPAEFKEARNRWTSFSMWAQNVFARIYDELGLEDPTSPGQTG